MSPTTNPPAPPPIKTTVWALVAFLLALPLLFSVGFPGPLAAAQTRPIPPKSLTVVLDKNYPPYAFSDAQGEIQGILVDQWKLWERQTGVPVTLVPLDWNAALEFFRQGRADVIDMLFDTETRRKEFALSKPYATIAVPIFVAKDLGGIHDVDSLRGFPVGVEKGDANVEHLASLGLGPLVRFENNEAIIQAAGQGKIKVFCVDKPPALYFLSKYGLLDEFRLGFTLYSGQLHRGVRPADTALLHFVEEGFDAIPANQYDAIEKHWRGTNLFSSTRLLRYALGALAAVAAVALALLSVNRMLRRTVRRQTSRLTDLLATANRSEQRYRELVESAGSAIVRLDPLGRVTYCNSFGQQLFGHSLAQMLGHKIEKLIDSPDDRESESWDAILDAVAADADKIEAPSRVRLVDRRQQNRDGRSIWMAWALRALCEAGRPIEFLCVGNDITERKQAEEALAASEARYALVTRSSNDGIWDWDLLTDKVYFSRRYLEILGLVPSGITPNAKEWTSRIHPDDIKAVIRENTRCANGEVDNFVVEYRMRHADGSYRWILARGASCRDATGRVVRMAGTHTDITRRKKDETALRESQDILDKIFRFSPVGIAITARRDGRIIELNEAAVRIFGYEKTEVVGRTSLELGLWSHPEERNKLMEELTRSGVLIGTELNLRHKNGSTIVTLYAAAPIQAYGEACLLTVLVDITERKAMEQALRRSKDAAEAANRAKSEFLSTMSHEIRTPMNTILGMASILAAANLPAEQSQALHAIEIAGANLLSLLNNILDMSQIEAGGLILEEKSCDIAVLAGSLIDMLRPDARRKGIDLRLEVQDKLPLVACCPDRVRQVLINLLGNALKFTKQGEIVLEIGPTDTPAPGPWLRLAVRDTGIGIPHNKLSAIFERFTQVDATTSRLYGGAGLGLTICKHLANLMGGHIRVDSEEGKGSVFSLTIPYRPLAMPPAGQPPQRSSAALARSSRPAKVLLVEDSPGNAEVTRLMLKETHFDLTWAPTAEAGLTAFRHTPFDLVLMDMEMPGMDGYAAATALRELEKELGRSHTPIIALTAHAFEEYRQHSLAAGCDDFQVKPITRAKLLDTLETWLAVGGS